MRGPAASCEEAEPAVSSVRRAKGGRLRVRRVKARYHLVDEAPADLATEGQDGFGMELDRRNGQGAVLDGHDDAVLGVRGDLEALG